MQGLGATDFLLFAAIAAAPIATGLFCWAAVRTSDDLLLANRSLPWWSMGVSLVLAGLAPAVCLAGPNEAYHAGLKMLLVPLFFWAAFPIVFRCTVPLLYNLELDSIYEYVELRFGPTARAAVAGLFLIGHLLWLAGLLALAVTVLPLGAGLAGKAAAAALLAGVAVGCAYCGGLKAVTASHFLQLLLLIAGLLLVVYVIGGSFERGPPRIWEIAHRMGRTRLVETSLDWSSKWTVWAAAPFCVATAMYFFLADQAALQRLVAARRRYDMQLGFLLAAVILGLVIPLAVYVGMGLLAFYQDHAQQEIPPEWVANVAAEAPHGKPRLAPGAVIDRHNIEQLAAAGVLLDPNTGRPFDDPRRLLGPDGEVLIDRLATRLPPRLGGERLLRRGEDQLLARFVARHIRQGAAGVVTAALAGTATAAISAGLIAMATVILVDFHRRFGWAERWLAARQGKSPDQLDQADELVLLRMLIIALGAAVAVLAAAIAGFGRPTSFLLAVLAVTASPLLGAMMLGLFSVRANSAGAMIGMASGAAAALLAHVGHHLAAVPGIGTVWPLSGPSGAFWPFLFGLAVCVVGGYAGSLVWGGRAKADQLVGLVVGLGRLGVLKNLHDTQLPASALESQSQAKGVKRQPQAETEQVLWLDHPQD